LLLSLTADAAGEVSVPLDVSPEDCGRLLLAFDTSVCSVTPIVPVDRLDVVGDAELYSPNEVSFAQFGYQVAAEGDTFIASAIGARDWDGAAWSFDRVDDEWVPSFEFLAPVAESLERLGWSVALSGDIAVLGAPGDFEYFEKAGSAWVFQRDAGLNSWTPVKRIAASDGHSQDEFGISVDVDGDLIAVGAPSEYDFKRGAAYVFRRDAGGPDQWGEVAIIEAPDGAGGDRFGAAVSIEGGLLAVGATGDDDLGSQSGSVYVFEEDAKQPDVWQIQAKLTASNGSGNDLFGWQVDLDLGRLAVGAWDANPTGLLAGAAYVFARDIETGEWDEVAAVTASVPEVQMDFGTSLDLEGSLLAVGATGGDGGSAYLFTEIEGRWAEAVLVKPANVRSDEEFAQGVALTGEHLLVGSNIDEDVGDLAGSVYALRWSAPVMRVARGGRCPGAVTLEVTGTAPSSRVALLYGVPGARSKRSIADCSSVSVDLVDPTLSGIFTTDASGSTTISRSLDSGCDAAFQLVDLSTCSASSVVFPAQ